MFTVNIKGRRDPKNIHFVKLEMVFYKRGYARVTKVINITGPTRSGVKSHSFSSEKNLSKRISFFNSKSSNTSKLVSDGMPKVKTGFLWSYLITTILTQTIETNTSQSQMLSKNWQ